VGPIFVAVKHLANKGATISEILELIQELEPVLKTSTEIAARNTPSSTEIIQEDQLVSQESSIPSIYIDTSKQVTSSNKRARARRRIADTDLDFNRFWQIYPRRLGKGAARKAWQKALALAPAEELVAKATAFAASCQGKDLEFVVYPATWLNQERWLDENTKETKDFRMPPKRTWAEIKADRGTNALVRGDVQSQEGRTGSKEPKMARVSDFLPPLLPVDDPQENQAAVFAEAVSDEVSLCGDGWDESPPFDLPN
jgi:hypothetical protein